MTTNIKLKSRNIAIISIVTYIFINILLLIIQRSIDDRELIHRFSILINSIFLGVFFILIANYFLKNKRIHGLYKYRYYLLGGAFFIAVFVFKINLSSFQAYEMFLPNNLAHINQLQIGSYRGIRSDEWGVLTPLQFSQYANDYGLKSSLLGENINISAISGGIPTKDLSIIGKPFLWGYLLFGNEIGLSWYTISKILLLIVFSYELLLILIKNKKYSLIGSLIITFSPIIQWWYTTNAQFTESVIYLEMIIVCLFKIFTLTQSKLKYFNIILLIISMIGFTFVLYPPFQIPLFYLGIALLIGIYLDNKENIKINKNNFIILGCVLCIYLLISGSIIYNMLPEIKKIMSTVYPGKRVGIGGGLPLEYLFNYIPSLLLPYKDIHYLNSSEISSCITLFPIPLMVYVSYKSELKSNVIKALIVFCSVSLIYMYVGFPKILAKITLISMVTEVRLYTIFSLACSILVVCMALYIKNKRKRIPWLQLCIYVIISYYIFRNYPNLIEYLGVKIFIFIILFILFTIYIMNNDGKVFINILLIVTFVSGLSVNPINFGTAKLDDTPFSKTVKSINADDAGRWITIDDIWLSKYMLAQGIEVLNALNYPPMLETWGKLDENNSFDEVYNRYAHVKVSINNIDKPKFSLVQADIFDVNFSENDLKTLGIKYIVSRQRLDNIANLELIEKDDLDDIFIYKNVNI